MIDTQCDEIVILTGDELLLAVLAAGLRKVQAFAHGMQHKCGSDLTDGGTGWSMEIEGICGELATAKYTGRYWLGPGVMRGDDVPGLQVRTTRHAQGCLIAHPEDLDAAAFVLVTGSAPRFHVRGWLYGHEIKQPKYWRTSVDYPAYFVPQAALRPAYDLRDGATR